MSRRLGFYAGLLLLALAAVVTAQKGGKGGKGGPPPAPEIAYVDNGVLKIMDADGGNPTRVLSGNNSLTVPSWSPDGSEIAFNSVASRADGIYVVGVDGSGLRQVASLASPYVNGPAWSPAGVAPWLLFVDVGLQATPGSGARDIFAVRPDGTGRFNLTETSQRSELAVSWGPQGNRIAIGHAFGVVVLQLAWVGGAPTVVSETEIMNVPGSPLQGIRGGNYFVSWAKTQDKIVSSVTIANQFDLWIIDLSAPTQPINITGTPTIWERQGTWSADDTRIAFWRDVPERKGDGIVSVRADGSDLKSLALGRLIRGPDWRR